MLRRMPHERREGSVKQNREWQLLAAIENMYREILGNTLKGFYVHGSLAFGCFRWEISDVDFIAVTNRSLTLSEKTKIIRGLLSQESSGPPKGLEMSVVQQDVTNPVVYPTPYELHYSAAHRMEFLADMEGTCMRMQGTDRDLAAHFAVIRQVGIKVWGKPIKEMFGPVPRDAYEDSIRRDAQDALLEISQRPVYAILNLCRVLAFERQGLVLSKKGGGEWGMKHLPPEYGEVVRAAYEYYIGSGGGDLQKDQLRRIADYMKKELERNVGKGLDKMEVPE